jgi:hypothetical protein
MFSPEERESIREALVSMAVADKRMTGAALTGSGALGHEDEWSDIDLAFGIADEADIGQVIADWSDRMYQEHGAVHHTDVTAGATIYCAFLLSSTLQVDLGFSPASQFGATAPSFMLVHGTARERLPTSWPSAMELLGLGWLHALHARSAIERRRVWQAEYMISGVRDHALALACLRNGVSPNQGRGVDSLTSEVTDGLTGALVCSLKIAELRRAFSVASQSLLAEAGHVDADLARRLASPLAELAGFPRPDDSQL